MQAGPTILKAAWVAPMEGVMLRDGAVAISGGTILAVGPASELLPAHPGAKVLDLGDSILLPGLVNAHTHLELSLRQSGASPNGSFTDWIRKVARGREADDPAEATRAGIAQCLKFGVTCVGDIAQPAKAVREVIRASPLRCVSYGEALGLGGLRWKFDSLLESAIDTTLQSDRLRIGLSPHAPYTVDLPGYRQCLKIAADRRIPLTTHLAETPDESKFLKEQRGVFRSLWESFGTWSDGVETFRGSPIEMAQAVGLLEHPTSLAHVNYCSDAELDILSRGKASVVYCPRTHRYFGHPPHRWREMLERGINVAVGTDSLASSPDLNLVQELRLLRQIVPDLPALKLWEMATIRAARAIRMEGEIGSLVVGKRADLVAFRVGGANPLEKLLDSSALPSRVWIDGKSVI